MVERAVGPSGSDVGLLADVAIPYGAQVTIVAEAKKKAGEWVTEALASEFGTLTIRCDRPLCMGERFIVVRCPKPGPAPFLHWAVLVEHIEELAEEAEQRAMRILRSSSR